MLKFKNMFEINFSQLIQYEILEKLVTYMDGSLSVPVLVLVSVPHMNSCKTSDEG